MDDIGEFYAGHPPIGGGEGMDKKVTRCASMRVPCFPIRVSVDNEMFDDAVAAIDFEQHLYVEFWAPVHVKANFPPTQVK
jgi:hypothetical protein